jgi:DNA-binding MarR family transcriptional regulator
MKTENLMITTAEERVLALWKAQVEKTGAAPSQRYIARTLELAASTVGYLVKSLTKKGYLRKEKITATRLALSAKAKKVPA